ncbi:MAG: hypothetical protein AAGI48_16600 [Verrucomicrobiota bacterium]
MKASILISVLILLVTAVLGWQGREKLVVLKEQHAGVVSEAEALGIPLDGDFSQSELRRPLERERRDRESAARKLAEEVIAFAKKMKEVEKSGEGPDEDLQKETMQMMRRFLDLDAHQLKALIAVLRESDEIDDEMRTGIVGFSIMMLANESPETALALYTETSDMLEMDGMGKHVITSALNQWAAKDPFGALDWIRENGEKNPDLVTDETKAGVIAGAARQDPTLALGLIDELELKEVYRATDGIARAARTSEQRTALLGALRANGDASKHGDQVLTSLGGQLASEGFEGSAAWMEEAELSDEETTALFNGISYYNSKEETGEWIDWAGENIAGDENLKTRVSDLMSQWTREDFKAAGTWLNDAGDGPAKESAVASYAETVAPYEPEAAAQWALTLPEGENRRELVRKVHQNWKEKDETAAAAFAAEQGIE